MADAVIIIGSGVLALLLVTAVEYADGYPFLSGAWFSHVFTLLGNTFTNTSTVTVALPAVIYLWWRGIMLGQSTSYFKNIYRSFVIGMIALILLIVIWQSGAMAVDSTSPVQARPERYRLFFFGLLSIAICHLYIMRSTMPKKGCLNFVWRWMPLMLGIIGGMVVVGFLVASIFSPEMMGSLGTGLKTVGGWLIQLFEWILTPVFYLFAGILYVARWLLSLLRNDAPQDTQNMTPPGGLPGWEEVTGGGLPPWVEALIKWIAVAIIVGLIIFILARTISKYRAKKARDEWMRSTNRSLAGKA